jgi:hypothetical protein
VAGIEDLVKLNYGDYRGWRVIFVSSHANGFVDQRGTSVLKKQSRQVLTLTKQGKRLIRRHSFLAGR